MKKKILLSVFAGLLLAGQESFGRRDVSADAVPGLSVQEILTGNTGAFAALKDVDDYTAPLVSGQAVSVLKSGAVDSSGDLMSLLQKALGYIRSLQSQIEELQNQQKTTVQEAESFSGSDSKSYWDIQDELKSILSGLGVSSERISSYIYGWKSPASKIIPSSYSAKYTSSEVASLAQRAADAFYATDRDGRTIVDFDTFKTTALSWYSQNDEFNKMFDQSTQAKTGEHLYAPSNALSSLAQNPSVISALRNIYNNQQYKFSGQLIWSVFDAASDTLSSTLRIRDDQDTIFFSSYGMERSYNLVTNLLKSMELKNTEFGTTLIATNTSVTNLIDDFFAHIDGSQVWIYKDHPALEPIKAAIRIVYNSSAFKGQESSERNLYRLQAYDEVYQRLLSDLYLSGDDADKLPWDLEGLGITVSTTNKYGYIGISDLVQQVKDKAIKIVRSYDPSAQAPFSAKASYLNDKYTALLNNAWNDAKKDRSHIFTAEFQAFVQSNYSDFIQFIQSYTLNTGYYYIEAALLKKDYDRLVTYLQVIANQFSTYKKDADFYDEMNQITKSDVETYMGYMGYTDTSVSAFERLSVADLKKQYLKKAREWHPDKAGATSTVRFQNLASAYEFLDLAKSAKGKVVSRKATGAESPAPGLDPNQFAIVIRK